MWLKVVLAYLAAVFRRDLRMNRRATHSARRPTKEPRNTAPRRGPAYVNVIRARERGVRYGRLVSLSLLMEGALWTTVIGPR